MQELAGRIQAAARSRSVVIFGETGSGKELVARAIHEVGIQKYPGKLMVVNCGNLNKDLVGSELFGHERGSFTGANDRHTGVFEIADKGTVFLDEVSEMPMELQPRLLRVLETGEFNRVGGTSTVSTKFRIVAATNKDLLAQVAAGSFRKDLYYRLNVIPLVVPSLRDRPEDIEFLASQFVAELSGKELSEAALVLLQAHSWPGNVRELRNVIERASVFSGLDNTISPEHIVIDEFSIGEQNIEPALEQMTELALKIGFWPTIAMIEKAIFRKALEVGGTPSGAAKKLHMVSIKTIYNKMRAYGMWELAAQKAKKKS